MFSDARSFWTSASSAIATINENISTALDKIDQDIDHEDGEPSVKEVVDQLKADLETYKSMLEDAQMQHFELSKQSRILVAEKEAELQHYKQTTGTDESVASSEDNSLKFKKLLAEKMVLDASLKEAQEQLSLVLAEKNEYLVMKKTHEEVMARFQNVKSDFTSMKVDTDSKEKDRNETIENLVAEYSKLAAETELYQQQADKRVAEVMRENEILVTKMHALEHSINELADRSVAPSPLAVTSSPSSGSKNASRSDLSATPTNFGASDADLREARSKIVNLQYDIKEKEAEIVKLRSEVAAAQAAQTANQLAVPAVTSSYPSLNNGYVSSFETELTNMTIKFREESSKNETVERTLAKLQADLDNQARDLSRLLVEKKEADEAGRKYHEQYKTAQQQYETLVRTQRQQQEAQAAQEAVAGKSADGAAEVAQAAAKEAQTVLQAEVEQLKQQIDALQEKNTQDIGAASAAAEQALSAAKETETQLQSEISALTEQVSALQQQQQVQDASANSAADQALLAAKESEQKLQAEVARLTEQVGALQEQQAQGVSATSAADVALAAAKDTEAQLQAEVARLTEQVGTLQTQLGSALAAGATSESALTAARLHEASLKTEIEKIQAQIVAIQDEHIAAVGASGEVDAAYTAAKAQQAQLQAQVITLTEQIASLQGEHAAAVEVNAQMATKATEELIATHESALATLRSELELAHGKLASEKEASHAQVLAEEATKRAQAAAAHEEALQALTAEHTAQLIAHQTEKESLCVSLEEKKTEMENMKAQYEAQIQASLSGSDSERQSLIADYMQQIQNLQDELTAAQNALAEKSIELSALQEQYTELQAQFTAERAQVESLTAQLSAAAQAATEATAAHAAALQAQTEAAQEALETAVEAERAAAAQAMQDAEESMSILRDTHREELLGELDLQKTELEAAHATAQQQALTQAATEATQALSQALEEQQHALEAEALSKLTLSQEAAAQDKQAALEANTATHLAQQTAALAAQADSHAQQLAAALQELTAEQTHLREAALEQLREQKQAELESAVTELQAQAASAMQAAQEDFANKKTALEEKIAGLQAELANAEDKHKALTATALASLEQSKEAEKTAALVALRAELKGEVDAAHKERDEHLENYAKERKLRKKIHNRLLEIQGNIRVLCRIRPILEVERRSGEDVDVTEVPNEEELYVQRDQQCRTRYEYDRVFPQHSTQEEVFEAVQPLCVSVLDGYNVCIFAYGQTGSGKTFTMEGSPANKGVSPRAIQELLNQVEGLKETSTYTVTLSMLEIYNETILDLLPLGGVSKDREKLEIRQTGDGGNQVVGLTETIITSMTQVEELMKQGQRNRAVGSHDMNEHSSRSHSIITLVARGKNHIDNTTTYGKLHLIDLAGSERVGKTDATGDRLKEAQNINKSLSALGEVINALGNKKATHVPYRNSKLTFLLQDSLGGNSKVLTFVNISPAVYNLGETVCSLNFATRCRSTELGQAKKQSGPSGEESATKSSATGGSSSSSSGMRRVTSSASTNSLNSSGLLTPASKR